MELSPYLIWNVFITLIIAPILFSIRQNFVEIKRVEVLLNKTREEMAKVYVTKNELENKSKAYYSKNFMPQYPDNIKFYTCKEHKKQN